MDIRTERGYPSLLPPFQNHPLQEQSPVAQAVTGQALLSHSGQLMGLPGTQAAEMLGSEVAHRKGHKQRSTPDT